MPVVRPVVRAAFVGAAVAATVLATPRPARAQIPEKFENLQVLPKDIPRDTLLRVMRGFTAALGVRCDFCHMERERAAAAPPARGGPPPLEDFYLPGDVQIERAARLLIEY